MIGASAAGLGARDLLVVAAPRSPGRARSLAPDECRPSSRPFAVA